ncbi:glycosyltransferase [Mucilaginibacter pallidiroseus]|uniref:Glycosyltransferase n=1 Tax=Mucilaginibacter pallidiroseus TaxID=2599295 RepID=A0A563UJQ2_9SPHI|nr:glycosyltransferase family 2 protein [Mucilaginibacter pallidiroseus]TWR31518.1 glycosyltransferase [Mucilaginibacter pallidiroseus]
MLIKNRQHDQIYIICAKNSYQYVPYPKLTVITVAFNASKTLERCINSVLSQQYDNIEYILIDGGSTDDSALIFEQYRDRIDVLISEPDNGLYDAMNKGIALATGDVIGMLNADDFYADESVLSEIAQAFTTGTIDAVYADLDYIDETDKVVRKWCAGRYTHGLFNYGWMPPHPTFYCKRELYRTLNHYSLNYGTAADYELMLRFIHINKIKLVYIERILVKMTVGGVSNSSLQNRLNSLRHDLRAMRHNGIKMPYISLLMKPLRKLKQFL